MKLFDKLREAVNEEFENEVVVNVSILDAINETEAELENVLKEAIESLSPITSSVLIGPNLPDDYKFIVSMSAKELKDIINAIYKLRDIGK